MRFAVWPDIGQPWDAVVDVARHAEATGWDGIYVADHFMPNQEDTSGPVMECWGAITGLAALVPRLRIGTLVCGNTYRHPTVLLNQAVAADIVSGGRILLGLGAGWQENEHTAYGIPFFTLKERMDRFEEACRIVIGLRDDAPLTFTGEHYQLVDAPLAPPPTGPLHLLVGGGGEKRTMRVAAELADEWNVWSDPALMAHKRTVLDAHCEALDRDPATITRSTQALLFLSTDEQWLAGIRDRGIPRPTIIGSPDEVVEVVAAYQAAGVDELIIPDFTLGGGQRRADTLDLFNTEVAPHFR
jgi:F420-dependent oxidoreductase-like protein